MKDDKLHIIYRDPITGKVMRTPDSKRYWRWKRFLPGGRDDYRTCQGGGIHLYFPCCRQRGNVVDYLQKHPNAPVYITEGEKKAAKAWLEGIPCIGIAGIWCWLANRGDRPDGQKKLHPAFDLIPDLSGRDVFMVYDSDAADPDKRDDFDKCSRAFERCLRARGVSRYEKIVLPSIDEKKTGLDDYLMTHSVSDFQRVVADQSRTAPVSNYIMTSTRFLRRNSPPIRFVVQPWLTDSQLSMIHAAPGVRACWPPARRRPRLRQMRDAGVSPTTSKTALHL